jgi:hypothetical protein
LGKIRGLLLIFTGLITGLILGKLIFISLALEVLLILWGVLAAGALSIALLPYLRSQIIRETHSCPKCKKPITRVRRTTFDRFLGNFIPDLRRYSCSEPFCRWTGLVVVKEEHFHSHSHSHTTSRESIEK